MSLFYVIIDIYQAKAKIPPTATMKDLNDYYRNHKFRTTLANFHSYCQRQSQQSSIIVDTRSKSATNIANYKSVRQLRKKSLNKSAILVKQAKIKTEPNIDDHKLNIGNSDLIEIIRLKLKSDGYKSLIEPTPYKEYKKRSQNQRHIGYSQFYSKTSKQSPAIKAKKKRIELMVCNTKIKLSLNPKSKRQQKIQEMIVTLQNRPVSAAARYRTLVKTGSSFQQSRRYEAGMKKDKLQSLENTFQQTKKEICGWDLPEQQQDHFQLQVPSRKRPKK